MSNNTCRNCGKKLTEPFEVDMCMICMEKGIHVPEGVRIVRPVHIVEVPDETKQIEEALEIITAEYVGWNDETQKKWMEAYTYIRYKLGLPLKEEE